MAITDDESARAWLEGKPREVQVAFAARCALRALPSVAIAPGIPTKQIILPALRAVLTAGVASVAPNSELAVLELPIKQFSQAGLDDSGDRQVRSAVSAADAADRALRVARIASATPSRPHWAAQAASLAASSMRGSDANPGENQVLPFPSAFSAADFDASYFDNRADVRAVFNSHLWPEDNGLWRWQDASYKLVVFFMADPEIWDFWLRWYRGMLNGRPLPWELQREVAWIPNDVWEAGAEAVAARVEEIEARFELRQRIKELEGEVARASYDRFGIGGNNPPEAVNDPSDLPKELLVVWQPLQELKDQIEEDSPDPSLIWELIQKLASALKAGLAWCASKTDLAVDTTIKWGIPIAGGHLLMNPQKLEAVIEAAKIWLPFLH